MEKKDGINLNYIIAFSMENIKYIIFSTIIFLVIGLSYSFLHKSYKLEANFYVNEQVYKEMGQDPTMILNSFEFLENLNEKSKNMNEIFYLKKEKDYRLYGDILKVIKVEKTINNSIIRLTINAKEKEKSIEFFNEYKNISEEFLENKKDKYFKELINNLENQYSYMNENSDLSLEKDPLANSLISKIANSKFYLEDNKKMIDMIDLKIKNNVNKKMILALSLVLGIFSGLFVAGVKTIIKDEN